MKLSDYVMQFVAGKGVRQVFLLPGGGAMHLNDSLGRCPGLEYVCNLHEQACAIAAEAYARVTNRLGVCLVTTGPGGTNAVTGLAGAWLDSTPCLFLSGQVKRADLKGDTGLRMLGVQEIDIVSVVEPITKYAVTVTDPASIRYHLEKAYYLAMTGRRGPVWIDLPLDVQAATIDPEQLPGYESEEAPASAGPGLPGQVARAVEMLSAAERPVLLVGNGVRMAGAERTFLQLVEALNVPVQTTWLGLDLIPDNHPLFAGRPGSIAPRGANFTLQNSDLLLTIGARLDMALTAYAHDRLARAARKVIVDIDPAEIRKLKTEVHLPVVADAWDFIDELLRQVGGSRPKDRAAWLARCREWKAKYPVVQPEHRNRAEGLSHYHFSEVLSDEMAGTDLVVPGSSGFASEIFLLVLKVKRGQRCFHNRGTGAMGFGLPASIGACLAGGGRRTVTVDGDGGFQMNVQELATVARLGLPLKYFVINNQGYASIRAAQQNYFGRLVAADATSGLTLPDLTAVASAYGVPATRINSAADLRRRVREVLDAPGPVVCDVVVAPDEPRCPRVASVQRPDGSMASKPLEDLWPFLDRAEFRANMLIPTLDD